MKNLWTNRRLYVRVAVWVLSLVLTVWSYLIVVLWNQLFIKKGLSQYYLVEFLAFIFLCTSAVFILAYYLHVFVRANKNNFLGYWFYQYAIFSCVDAAAIDKLYEILIKAHDANYYNNTDLAEYLSAAQIKALSKQNASNAQVMWAVLQNEPIFLTKLIANEIVLDVKALFSDTPLNLIAYKLNTCVSELMSEQVVYYIKFLHELATLMIEAVPEAKQAIMLISDNKNKLKEAFGPIAIN